MTTAVRPVGAPHTAIGPYRRDHPAPANRRRGLTAGRGPENRQATRRIGPQLLSDAQMPRSSRKRSIGAELASAWIR